MATDFKRLEVKLRQLEDLLDEAKRQLRLGHPIAERATLALRNLEEVFDLLDNLIMEDS